MVISDKTKKNAMSMYYRYFVYSAEEEALRIQVHGPDVKFGVVFVHGVAKRFTSIVASMDDTRADAIVLIQGDIRKIKYLMPKDIK